MLNEYSDLLSVKDVQNILSIGRTTAYKLIRDGELPYITVRRQIRVYKKTLLDFLVARSYTVHSNNGAGHGKEEVYECQPSS